MTALSAYKGNFDQPVDAIFEKNVACMRNEQNKNSEVVITDATYSMAGR